MILIFVLSFAAALAVGHKIDAARLTQAQTLALYLIIMGSAVGAVWEASKIAWM